MSVCPRSLLLGLLVILYLQSCVVGQNGKEPKECCFSFYTRPIHASHITKYEETRADCWRAGVFFTDLKGRRLCVDPSFRWVQRAMNMIDRRIVEGSDSTQPSD